MKFFYNNRKLWMNPKQYLDYYSLLRNRPTEMKSLMQVNGHCIHLYIVFVVMLKKAATRHAYNAVKVMLKN